MGTPTDRSYSTSHEWVKVEGDLAIIGITDHAQDSLGDITFVEPPNAGESVEKGKECCVVESVKAASDIYAPVGGEVAEINGELESTPETINSDPYGAGWIFKIKGFNNNDLGDLMDAAAYDAFVESEA